MPLDVTEQIQQYLTRAPSSLFAQQTIEVLAHWEGDTHLLWRVRAGHQDATVKLFLDAGQARSRRQFDGQTIFAPFGLAPQPLWVDRYPHGLSRQLMVYQWAEGESINTADPSELTAWAEAIAMVHAAPADAVRRFSPHPLNLDYYWRIEQASIGQVTQWLATSDLSLYPFFEQMASATAALVQQGLSLWAYAMPTPVHGDLARQHTLIERGRVVLLDWEMFGLGDPAQDVARLLQREAQHMTPHQIEAWLAAYTTLVDQPNINERIRLFQQLLDVHNVVYLLIGLQQHTQQGVDADLAAALPYMQATLATAIERAQAALSLSSFDVQRATVDFVQWLSEGPAAPQSQ